MKTELYNQEGKVIGEIDLPENIFGVKLNPDFLHQVYTSLLSNKRKPLAHTKDRSEVRGGGKKPWRQKGTGRARHGSIRSPLWKGGGVTFGPRKEKKYLKKVNKKMYRQALNMIFAEKLRRQKLKIVQELNLPEVKTREMEKIIQNLLPVTITKKPSTVLLLVENKREDLFRAGANLSYLDIRTTENIDFFSLLKNKYLILSQKTLPMLEKKQTLHF